MAPRDKMLEPIRGLPLLRDRTKMCLRAGIGPVTVVLAPDKPERLGSIRDLGVNIAYNSGASCGLADSLKAGIANVAYGDVLVVLADLPDLTASDLRSVAHYANESQALLIRGSTSTGIPGHPVFIKRELFQDINALEGDSGASQLFKKYHTETERVPLPRTHATLDLDTPQAWEAWRKKNADPASN